MPDARDADLVCRSRPIECCRVGLGCITHGDGTEHGFCQAESCQGPLTGGVSQDDLRGKMHLGSVTIKR